MPTSVIFIHGMFQTPRSWTHWQEVFGRAGYRCVSPAWPFHDGDPARLRAQIPEGLGDLTLEQVEAAMREVVLRETRSGQLPIVIGHSVGGLIAQKLAVDGLVSAAVPIAPVAPNRMMTLDWPMLKNVTTIANPFKGDAPVVQTAESFHEAFCNTLDDAAARRAFQETCVHDSRNVLRGCLGEAGRIDVAAPHAPMLFIGAQEDRICPTELVEKTSKAYTDDSSLRGFKEYGGRSHFICGEPGWEEVADAALTFVERVPMHGRVVQPRVARILTPVPGR